jgi:signal transduction histidine kinase
MPYRQDRAMNTVLGWTVFTFAFPWLVFVASLAAPDFQWSFFGLGGSGTGGHFWLATLLVVFAALVFYLGWRGARRAFQSLVLAWHLALFALMVYGVWTLGDDMTFQAAAFGLRIPLSWIGPLVFGSIAVVTVLWVARDLRTPAPVLPTPSWRDLDRRALLLAILLAPVVLIALRLGPVDGALAKIGFLAAIVQWVAIAEAMGISLPSRAELRRQRALKEAVRAQLQALQARTHPHFLFNTLNTVAGLIEEDPRRAEELVTRLAQLYRHVLGRSERERVTLGEELQAVSDYLEIEAVRFGERLRWRLELDEGSKEVDVLPFVLQPLVENAVLHGVGSRPEGGEVRVRVESRRDRLLLSVEDDGPGPGGSQHCDGSGTALAGLEERLALAYGPSARLDWRRGSLGGFRVTVSLPLDARGVESA